MPGFDYSRIWKFYGLLIAFRHSWSKKRISVSRNKNIRINYMVSIRSDTKPPGDHLITTTFREVLKLLDVIAIHFPHRKNKLDFIAAKKTKWDLKATRLRERISAKKII